MTDLRAFENDLLDKIAAANDEAAIEAVRIATFGKSGSVSALLKTLGSMTPAERKERGALINGLKERLAATIAARKNELKTATLDARLNSETVDVTLPVREPPAEIGRIHPVTQVTEELVAIFADMGFSVAEGPDIETDDYNFGKLNFPTIILRARCTTLFTSHQAGWLSPSAADAYVPGADQDHAAKSPPIRVIIPGRTYRSDSDQTHTPMFHQVEGLVIDRSSHLGHLNGSCTNSAKLFSKWMKSRCVFVHLTFPSPNLRSKSIFNAGAERRDPFRRGGGLAGNPRLRDGASECAAQLRPRSRRIQGFAWGLGIDRMAMLKYGMPDLRAFFEADVRWLSHYGFRPLDFPTLAGGLSG